MANLRLLESSETAFMFKLFIAWFHQKCAGVRRFVCHIFISSCRNAEMIEISRSKPELQLESLTRLIHWIKEERFSVLIQTLICWTRRERRSVFTSRFKHRFTERDRIKSWFWTKDPLDQMTPWFWHWFTQWERSKFLTWPNKSPIQTRICRTKEEWISVLTERFTDSNTDRMTKRRVNQPIPKLTRWMKGVRLFLDKRFTDSRNEWGV